ncbi:TPA: Nif3-like dinuclear metal center hexameric protein [Candidatus Avigastranaerophilus faecigallinarum]|nr:Nif3-like dinuclear metal center hexameric protein [Candidatus Avigastranaerophilus faecigallinarum]
MEKVSKIIKRIEEFAPLNTMQKWDNSGWQINLGIEDTNRILLALDVTPSTVDEAINKKCDLIISHHPIFFNSIKTIESPFIIKAIQNNIQVYSAHTNLDIAQGGVSEYLAEKCGFTDLDTAFEFIKYKQFDEEKNFSKLISTLKTIFSLPSVRVVNSQRKTYKSIAFCSGSGAEYIQELEKIGIDVFITGDLKHHQALNATNMTIVDLGHFHSERFVVEIFENILKNEDVEVIAAVEKPAWELI